VQVAVSGRDAVEVRTAASVEVAIKAAADEGAKPGETDPVSVLMTPGVHETV
jgi:hypothetical protein